MSAGFVGGREGVGSEHKKRLYKMETRNHKRMNAVALSDIQGFVSVTMYKPYKTWSLLKSVEEGVQGGGAIEALITGSPSKGWSPVL